jgi:hypothetical protein
MNVRYDTTLVFLNSLQLSELNIGDTVCPIPQHVGSDTLNGHQPVPKTKLLYLPKKCALSLFVRPIGAVAAVAQLDAILLDKSQR